MASNPIRVRRVWSLSDSEGTLGGVIPHGNLKIRCAASAKKGFFNRSSRWPECDRGLRYGLDRVFVAEPEPRLLLGSVLLALPILIPKMSPFVTPFLRFILVTRLRCTVCNGQT